MTASAGRIEAMAPGSPGPEENQYPNAGPVHFPMNMRLPAWRPPVDVYETDDALVVRVEIAGMQESDLQIELSGKVLSIHGARSDTQERRAYHQMEIRFGEFHCEVEIPVPVQVEGVDATYTNGFLLVVMPKAASRQAPAKEA